ncbi:hypothetical protein HanRHA438_Chr04g0176391 [Helianthus annuus]|uniref:DUF868 family protein n=1 Tax=Helianthus annuus TaxID=4232 RepID=A0A9K3J852_HELAN|nr:uncharacterized protein LOC110933594 [Helianthus annuus]KAF5810207.1 hypothetical protein HanXRQr2_Chr04g0166741 [Helianthus annuus]KAJ0581075.1 hypothetical protein HanHA300_Chr04g0136811 [Helianthus annuus]KAJ0597021.1 hypothetical protein HanHA89_Chr04g0149761 [Helianthus annuus]KAJ0757703.1 hypothetical protein HanLR1_Chr04g0141871 [Helianthus annuus]KAJ0761385.1 hypothetical protein HanOQP8_Chr04g0149261 [Helianthus annuus]
MNNFPSCFSEHGVQIIDSSCSNASSTITSIIPKPSQNIVTCIYHCKLLNKSHLIIINWSKNLVGHCFTVEIEDPSHESLSKIHVKPSMFSKRKGSKSVTFNLITVDLNWDLTDAKFGSSPEPIAGFFVCLVFDGEMVLLIGDTTKEMAENNKCWLRLMKREHVFGSKVYVTKAQFEDHGRVHDLKIECDTIGVDDPWLMVRLDGKIVMQVKHLVWKFRGNSRILVDGLPVEVYWDVHNWLFGSTTGSAVFMFRTCSVVDRSNVAWAGLRSSSFCLMVYAWKNE